MLLLLLLVSTAVADQCTHTYNNTKYSKSTILTFKGFPTNLVYDPHSKELLFTLIDIENVPNPELQDKLGVYILRNGQKILIDNVNGEAAAVDERNNRVYIASNNGLYVLNGTDKASFVGLEGEYISNLYKPKNSDDLYAIMALTSEVYRIDRNYRKHRVENIPCAFHVAVDSHGNIFYACNSLFVLLKDSQETIEYVDIPKYTVKDIAIDDSGRVILATKDGLYWLKLDRTFEKLMSLDYEMGGLTFNGANIYVSTTDVIYEYKMCQ